MDTQLKRRVLKPALKTVMSIIIFAMIMPLAALKPVVKEIAAGDNSELINQGQQISPIEIIRQKDEDLTDIPQVQGNIRKSPASKLTTEKKEYSEQFEPVYTSTFPQQDTQIKKLYEIIMGEYMADMEGAYRIFTLYMKNGELWGSPKGENDPRKLTPIDKGSLVFQVEGEPITITFKKDNSGNIVECTVNIESEGSFISKKIDKADSAKLQKLYAELTGKYFYDDAGSGEAGIAFVFVKNGELWASPGNNEEARELIPLTGEELEFVVAGEAATVTFVRDGAGEVNKLIANIDDRGLSVSATKMVSKPLDPAKRKELSRLYSEIVGDYMALNQGQGEIFTLSVSGDELYGEIKGENDPRKLELIDFNSLKFHVSGEVFYVTFHKNDQGKILQGTVTDLSSNPLDTIMKISRDQNDPAVKEKLQNLFREVSGEYRFKDVGEGQPEVVRLYVQNDNLLGTPAQEDDPRRLLPLSIENMMFSVEGESIIVTFERDSGGKISGMRAKLDGGKQLVTGVKIK